MGRMVGARLFGVIKMTYKYTNASMAIVPKGQTEPKNQYIELFQETLNDQFYNSADWWNIEEETSVGSQVYAHLDVRVNHVINAETGLKLGDDWKTILFKDVDHNIELGKQYIFDSNTWLTINTEIIKNLTGTCTVRRCNNTLRWIEESTGAYYEEPCCIEYLVKEPRDYFTTGSPFTTPGGFLHIVMQFNERSNLINENQRFLFGNPEHWVCYKVVGTGINDFANLETYDSSTAKILTLDLVANFVNNELDDITNGIADVNTNLYTIALNHSTATGNVGNTIQLSSSITYNGKSVTRTVLWTSSDATKATVSTTGLVTLVALGTCTITGTIEGNAVHADCVTTVATGTLVNNEVRISPDTNYILEGTNRTYSVYLYENNVIQADVFTITCSANSVPTTNYTFSQTGVNAFKVTNILRDVSSYLTISCVSGSNTKSFNVYLRGAW
jgi:hypothetical protein